MNMFTILFGAGTIFPSVARFNAGLVGYVLLFTILGVGSYYYDKKVTEYPINLDKFELSIEGFENYGGLVKLNGYGRNHHDERVDRIYLTVKAFDCETPKKCYMVDRKDITILQSFKTGEKIGIQHEFNMKGITKNTRLEFDVKAIHADRGWF